MSAIYTDAADIPTAFPHPTGAATVINFHCVVPPFFTTTPNPTAPASSSPSSPSACNCYYSDPSSSSSSSASGSRLESRDSALPSPSRPASRDSAPPSPSRLAPRDFSLEAHQAEYRAHAYLANESIVKTKLAADKFLQTLFKTQSEPDKDILRAASAASRARLQNPFAYNNSRSSGSSGSSGSSSGSSSYYSGSSGSSGPSNSRSNSGTSNSSPSPSAPNPPTAPAPCRTAAQPNPVEHTSVPTPQAASDLAIWQSDHLTISPSDDQPFTEAEFTDCIKLDDAISIAAAAPAAAPKCPAPRSTAIPGGVFLNSSPTATPDAKTPPKMAAPQPAAAQPNPVKIVVAPAPAASSDLAIWPIGNLAVSPAATPSDLAIWQFDHLTISSCETISPPQPSCLNLATWPFSASSISPCTNSWPLGP